MAPNFFAAAAAGISCSSVNNGFLSRFAPFITTPPQLYYTHNFTYCNPYSLRRQKLQRLIFRYRSTIQVPLTNVAAAFLQIGDLLICFHTFRHNRHIHQVRHIHDGANDALGRAAFAQASAFTGRDIDPVAALLFAEIHRFIGAGNQLVDGFRRLQCSYADTGCNLQRLAFVQFDLQVGDG